MFLSLNVEYNNVEAKKLYQRIGFQEHKTIFIDKNHFLYEDCLSIFTVVFFVIKWIYK